MKSLNFQLFLKPEPTGGFTVIVPALPGCITYGRDVKHARAMAQDAISAYLASLEKHHEPLPGDDYLQTSVELDYAQAA